MERPERPSRPEKPNREATLRNSIRIRRRISSLLWEMGSHDSTDSESEDVSSVPSPSRRPVSRRYTDARCPYGGSSNNAQETVRHHSSPPAPVAISPPSRNYLDVFRSEPSSSSLLYTLQPFRSPQRPLPISVNHPLPMFHHHHHPASTGTGTSSFDPLSNGSRNRDFNILAQSTAAATAGGGGGGAMRDAHVERDRPSMSGTTFLVCDETSSINPPKRFCPGNMAAAFSSPRQQNSFSSSMLRDRSDPLPSTSSAVGGVEDLSMSISSMTRDTDRRLLSNNDALSDFGAQNSGERGGNDSFINSFRDDSLDGSDVIPMNREDGSAGGEGGSVPPSPPRPQFFAMGSTTGGISGGWMSPTRSRGSAASRMAALNRNLASHSSFILRAVDELEEARLRNRGMINDDAVMDEDLLPSSRPASDSDGIDEDVRTAVTNLEFLRDGGNSNDILSQVEVDRDRSSRPHHHPHPHSHATPSQAEEEGEEDQEADVMNIRFDHSHPSDEEVVLISVNGLSSAATAAMGRNDDNEELSDANSATTDPPEELSNEGFDVRNASSQENTCNSQADDAVATCNKPASTNSDEGQDFNAKLLALLECPVCLETIVPPIHQCRKGHPVCSVCRPRLTVCPTCRTRFTETRNLLMEKVADMMQFPCKNYMVGCTVSTALKDKSTHELGCGYRQYSCIDRDCQWKGFKQELLVHCNKLHLDKVIISRAATYCTLIIPFELHRQSSWVMSALDEVFLVTFKVYPHNILRGCTVYLGPPENAFSYNYYFKFGGKKRNKSFKYREMTIPHKTSIYSNEFFQDTCFSYQFDTNTFKLLNGKIVIEGKVAVTKVVHRSCR